MIIPESTIIPKHVRKSDEETEHERIYLLDYEGSLKPQFGKVVTEGGTGIPARGKQSRNI